jgi:CobQ-like glutamine amidotransferase family enzyme
MRSRNSSSGTFTLASFRPDLFNAIGDQGNIEVLAAELRWAGANPEVVQLTAENLRTADFVLFGSASLATMRALEPELAALAPLLMTRAEAGQATLFLGSSYVRFASEIFGLSASATAHVSDYYRANYESNPVVGYLNTDTTLPPLVVKGNQIGSLLSGPLLAKNRWLVKQLAGQLGFELRTPSSVTKLQRLASS